MADTSSDPSASDLATPGIFSSDNISLAVPHAGQGARPPALKHMSSPTYQSPIRHHRRGNTAPRHVKETLNAHSEYSNSEDDGTAQHRINQYVIEQEIGRGSFGSVHFAKDQYGNEFAVKEFSKSRLRKRAQSNLLRRPGGAKSPGGRLAPRLGFNSPLHRHSSGEENNSLDLIKEEIAVMKKLSHPNLVGLIEVLDDPQEDSLYMVLEICKKGVVMKVGLDERADPYDEEQCRCWFRDMILGIEYLHAQGIIHRDIKPDNCLVTDDDVLKIVDFGVSEMFQKDSEMRTAKSAGSPAFMPPELCVTKHGNVSGRAVDIWSMGVTLYALRHGRIPFEKGGMIEMYESIRSDPLQVDEDCNEQLKDLLRRLLEKDPDKRITMDEIRTHPWVTCNGEDPLLPTEENVSNVVEPPTEAEMDAAITGNMSHLFTVMKAAKRFKQLLFRRRPELMEGILGQASRIVQPPLSMRPNAQQRSTSANTEDRRPVEGALASEGIHREIEIEDEGVRRLPKEIDEVAVLSDKGSGPHYTKPSEAPTDQHLNRGKEHPATSHIQRQATSPAEHRGLTRHDTAGKGHAHDPLTDTLFLHVGTGVFGDSTSEYANNDGNDSFQPDDNEPLIVSESPPAADFNVFETAYEEQAKRILEEKQKREEEGGSRPTLFLNRRVESSNNIRENPHLKDYLNLEKIGNAPKAGFARLLDNIREHRGSIADKVEDKDESNEDATEEEGSVAKKARQDEEAEAEAVEEKEANQKA